MYQIADLVWEKLAAGNRDYFVVYETRLKLLEQITAFNYLVSQQTQLNLASSSLSFGSKPSLQENPIFRGTKISEEFSALVAKVQKQKSPPVSEEFMAPPKKAKTSKSKVPSVSSKPKKSSKKGVKSSESEASKKL